MRAILGPVVSVGGLVASTVVARSGVAAWERRVFRVWNDLPDELVYAAWGPMQAGALASPLLVGGLAAATRRRLGLGVAAAGVASWGAAKVLKRAVGRGRPADVGERATLRLGSADHGLGFPSGHAAVAASMAVTLGAVSVRSRYPMAGLAVIVGVSRVYVGAHLPLDVVGGWALGHVIGRATVGLIDRR